MKYEFRTKIELENNTTKDFIVGYDAATSSPVGMFPDGEKSRSDMPAMFAIGADYKLMNNDANTIINYLKKKGFTDADITISSISANQVWDDSEKLNKDYDLRQSIEVNSTNVNLIDTTSKNITMLADDGIVLNVNANYTYSKLADERVGLLSSAIDDARARAEAIADKSGRRIGNIQTASSGVVQVLAPGSIEVQDYGSYDTSTINKTIMVTAKVSFSFK